MTDTAANEPLDETGVNGRDPDHDPGDMLDTAYRAWLSEFTGGLSPAAAAQPLLDWAAHLAHAPGKQAQLMQLAADNWIRFGAYLVQGGDADKAPAAIDPKDRRFSHETWQAQPFHAMQQAFLLGQSWWDEATTGVRGVSASSEKAVNFAARQLLDAMSPANYLPSNPEILARTVESRGQNLRLGLQNYLEDLRYATLKERAPVSETYRVGETMAVTPGKVVFRNRLIELIQYEPATGAVHPEPVLIVPAWIMKYYILDLSPENSMIKYLTEQGFTVFAISWRNPDEDDADLGMDDYRVLGPMAALDQIGQLTGAERIHTVGYCLGGTLLSIAAAAMARDDDNRLASITLLAAQMDFTEAGELTLFINDGQVAFLEDMMWKTGYLDADQMAGAFQVLRSNDLIWSRVQHQYLMGERPQINDMMAWNADTTRMPYRMHSEYLRQMFLDNAFAAGKYKVDGRKVTPHDITAPIFAVGTETDHVAPWKSAYKTTVLTRSDVTFVLTNGGHNAGVVSEPGHRHRHYRVRDNLANEHELPPEEWEAAAERREGSWWPEWAAWLAARSGEQGPLPPLRPALCDAPGTYVMMR